MKAKNVSGSLKNVLHFSRTAWFEGSDGTRAYIEYPKGPVPGLLAVNGARIMGLVDNGSEELTESVLKELASRSVQLDSGWTCQAPLPPGMHLNEAVRESGYWAARHFTDKVIVQCLRENYRLPPGKQQCAVFVDGQRRWTVKIVEANQVLAELNIVTWCGWFPYQVNVLENEALWRRR